MAKVNRVRPAHEVAKIVEVEDTMIVHRQATLADCNKQFQASVKANPAKKPQVKTTAKPLRPT